MFFRLEDVESMIQLTQEWKKMFRFFYFCLFLEDTIHNKSNIITFKISMQFLYDKHLLLKEIMNTPVFFQAVNKFNVH